MYRALWILPLTSLLCLAADNSQKQEKKPVVDSSTMSSDVHAPLFQGPKSLEAGVNTERLASGLPKPAGPIQRVPRRNFIDNHIFGKMERDGDSACAAGDRPGVLSTHHARPDWPHSQPR